MKNTLAPPENIRTLRFTVHQWVAISCAFSLLLLVARIIMTHHLSYGFLAWNLFLAYVPYFISNWLGRHSETWKNHAKLFALVFLWLLFMPNSFYILTDLFHLKNTGKSQSWFDLTLLLSFAWNGMIFGIFSVQKMEALLTGAKGKLVSGIVICGVMWLNAFGIYIGRFLRFNSWDIFTNPFSLLSDIAGIVLRPYDYSHVWAMSACFAFFMIIIYYTIKKSAEVFRSA